VNSVKAFVQLVQSWRSLAQGYQVSPDVFGGQKGKVTTIMEEVVRRSGIESALKKAGGDETGEDHLANVNELITSATEYDAGNPEGSLEDYLSAISLVSDVDHMKGAAAP
jgi:superfamily I DNA/RNA helicase